MPTNRALFFATGGLAFGDVVAASSADAFDGANHDLYAGSKSGLRTGFAVGGGVDFALTRQIILTAEYLYYDLGTANYAVGPANSFAVGEGLAINASQRFNGSVIRFGLDYRFGG